MDLRIYSRLGVFLFGIVPTTILLLFSFIPLGLSFIFIFDDAHDFSILMMAAPLGGIVGYIGILSLCFKLPISNKQQIICLSIGVITILYIALGGIPDFNKPYNIGYRFWYVYAFIGPTIIAVYHLFKIIRSGKSVT